MQNASEFYTDKKENQIFLIYKEIQSGAVAKSYMRKSFLMYEEKRKYLTIYEDEEAVGHIWLCNCSILNFLIYEENLIFFLSVQLRWWLLCRVQLNKAVTESQDEIADLKEKMRALTHQFDQMKEEIIAKVILKETENKTCVINLCMECISLQSHTWNEATLFEYILSTPYFLLKQYLQYVGRLLKSKKVNHTGKNAI